MKYKQVLAFLKRRSTKRLPASLAFVLHSGFGVIIFLFAFFQESGAQRLTFSEHIGPIIFKNCTPCHSAEHGTPFSYLTYEDVKSKANVIRKVIETGYMPPWIADTSYTHFFNERVLGLKEKQQIISWIESGMPKGKGKSDYHSFSKKNGVDEEPDIILRMKNPFFIKGNNKESFPMIKIPYEFKTDSEYLDVRCIEFVPGNRKLLHHVNFEVLPALPTQDIFKEPYWTNYTPDDSAQKTYNMLDSLDLDKEKAIYYGGWLPGLSKQVYGDDFGIRLPKRGIMLINVMHISASPIDDYDDSYFKIYLKKSKVQRIAHWDVLGSGGTISPIVPPLIIPADSVKTFDTRFQLAFDISVMFINPHMHLLGKSFLAFAVLPSRDTIPLIRIKNWNFNWQEFYQINPMLTLPKGTWIIAQGEFDNTSNNPFNPFNPPRDCTAYGKMRTVDEMLGFGLMFFKYKPGDETKKVLVEE